MRLNQSKLVIELHHLAVAGWPWDTTGDEEWTDRATLADGLRPIPGIALTQRKKGLS